MLQPLSGRIANNAIETTRAWSTASVPTSDSAWLQPKSARHPVNGHLSGCCGAPLERRIKSLRKSPLGRYKEKNISWCLNEAMLDMERKKLGKCQVALISQDAQGPMLSVRFACVSNCAAKPQRGQLELHQGLLGLFHGQICGARRIARTTLRVAKTMFQARRKPPSGWCGKAPTFYKRLGSISAEGWNLGGKALLAPCFTTKCFSLTLTLLRKCLLRMRPLMN